MRTEIEILEKYSEMLQRKKELHDIVNNPPDDLSFEEIQNTINDYHHQCDMNNVVEWLLDLPSTA